MGKVFSDQNPFASHFTDRMAGGAFVCRRMEGHELLYVNEGIVRLFECDSPEEFMDFSGGSYDGMVNSSQLRTILKEVESQIRDRGQALGHLFYHVRTKKDNIRLVEEYWSVMTDETEGDLFYSVLVSREYEVGSTDIDPITGLYGKVRFESYVTSMNRNLTGKDESEYAIAYLNFVNFKLLNINKGVAEGDACLKTIADILAQVFEDAFLARLSDDHFAIFTRYSGIFEKLEACGQMFAEPFGNTYHIVGKTGIYKFVPNKDFDVEAALSFAKVACDYIKFDSRVDNVEYTESLAKKMKISEYVIHRIDEAIEKDWIKVYYQPVVRSLTHRLCGMESLVRWADMEMGFLMPDQIVGILEEHRQIHKLDCHVVEKVCQCIHDRVGRGLPVVPVSINFSRQDFISCDMLQVVEAAVEKYDVPRDFIHVEITESMIVEDEELMRDVIEKFRKVGYEIWMDDFGSGYSSLTLLKDYQFDMLKLDMKFLTPFTDKSKDIIRSTITMAKDLGIQTLAEGVETKEQLDFLTEVGCGKIQGYYYGRPEPIEDLFTHLAEKQISIETRKWRHFYEVASFHVRSTDVPLELIVDDGRSFQTLFMNKAYREQIRLGDLGLEEIDRRIYHTASPLLIKYREFAEQMKRSGKQEVFYYTNNGSYLCLRGQALVSQDEHSILKCSIYNIAADQNEGMTEKLDAKLRTLNLMFRVILLADLKNHTLMPLIGTSPNMKVPQMMLTDVNATNAFFAEQNIFPTERERYREFMDFSTARERVERSPFGFVSDIFRIKQPDGNYREGEVTLLMIPGTEGMEYLYCVKPHFASRRDHREGVEGLLERGAVDSGESGDAEFRKVLWNNFLWNSGIKFFWKDHEGRFLGGSQAFLDYFGLKSLEELIGKREEELCLCVNEARYREEETTILDKGEKLLGSVGQVIAKGRIHNIYYSKMPIYQKERIVGLVGYFFDCDVELAKVDEMIHDKDKDAVTGLMNVHAFIDAMIDYAEQYHSRGRDYGIIVLRNEKHQRILESYGEELANRMLKKMGDCIVRAVGTNGIIARIKESVFIVLFYPKEEGEAGERAEQIREKLEGINSVEGNPVTMRILTAVRLRSMEGSTDENMYELALKEVLGKNEE